MAIEKAEWSRRLEAALALRGRDLKDLPDVEGLAKRAAARAGHPSDDYRPSEVLAMATARELNVPVEWFTTENFDEWIGRLEDRLYSEERQEVVNEFRSYHAQLLARLSEIQATPLDSRYAELLASLSEVHTSLEQLRSLLRRGEGGAEDEGRG